MEALSKFRIPGEQRQILDFILRKTYGFNKKEDAISLSQFVKGTGLKKPNIVRSISVLLSKKIITVIKSDNKPAHIYKFNKNYDIWKPLSKKITLSKVIKGIIKSDNKSLSKVSTTKVDSTKATITKEKHGEFKNVKLTSKEYQKIIDKFPNTYNDKIENLSHYIESKGDKYKSHYATILNWDRREKKEKEDAKIKPKTYAQAQDAERREMVKTIKDLEDEEKNATKGTNKTTGLLSTT